MYVDGMGKRLEGMVERFLDLAWTKMFAMAFSLVGTVLLVLLGSGKMIAKRAMTEEALVAVRPALDSLSLRMTSVEERQELTERTQQEFFGAMMDADPRLRAAVEERAAENEQTANKKRRDSALLLRLGTR